MRRKLLRPAAFSPLPGRVRASGWLDEHSLA